MSLLDANPQTVAKILGQIDILPDSPDNCWLWLGGVNNNGYGYFCNNGKYWIAHRTVYFLLTREDPGNLLVCHKCDIRICCNPRHLFLGTHDDNQKDMARKGRAATGERHASRTMPERIRRGEESPKAKLRASQVDKIRSLYETNKFTQGALAKLFGVGLNTIRAIVRGESWGHLPSNTAVVRTAVKPRTGQCGERNATAKLNNDQVREIRELLTQGHTALSIARRYGVGDSTIYHIKHGKRWASVL